jgi:hypothetical protein
VPDELVEAARMDGAGPMRFFKDVLLPLSKTMAALFVIQFIYGWNQYLWPLLVTTDEKMYPVVMGIKRLIFGEVYIEWNVVMATAILAMLPPAIVVILMQKWFVKGLVDTEKRRLGEDLMASISLSQRRQEVRQGQAGTAGDPRRQRRDRRPRVHRHRRPLGLRQVDAAAHGGRAGGDQRRRDRHRRPRGQRARAGRARHRDGVPELRAVPAHERVRQHGLRPEDPQDADRRDQAARRQGRRHPGTGHLLDRKPRQLSGGQRQRVAMGRAIVRQPQVFLFDEPLSNLDAKLRAQTRLEIQKLHRELGITSLFVTHDQVEAMTLAQRMIVMNAGRMEQFGTPEEVYHRPATTFVASFIGSPPMNLLKDVQGGRNGAITGIRPEHLDVGDSGWEVRTETVELLGAERLIYGRLGGEQIIVRIEEGQPSPAAEPGDPRQAARGPPALVRRPDRPAHRGLRTRAALALPALDRAPRRRQAGAREHAGGLPPGRRSHGYRMFECDVKLSADGVPFLMHDATLERTTNGVGLGGDQPWDQSGAARRGQLAFTRLCRRTAADVRERCALVPGQRPFPQHRDQADAGQEQATGDVVARWAARIWAGAAVPPLLTSFGPNRWVAGRVALAQPQRVPPRV